MLLTLPESSFRGKRSTSWTLASVAAHAGVLLLWLSRQGLSVATADPREHTTRFVAPRPAEVRPRPVDRVAMPTTNLNSLPGVPTFTAPVIDLPSINAPALPTSFDASAYELRGIAAAPGFGANDTPAPAPGTVLTEHTVDRRVEPRAGNPIPRYPPSLASMGVSGRVIMRFVVDSLGAVDRGSVEALLSTHPLFEKSVREALVRMRFVPAMLGKSKVAQLVEMPFHFEIKR